ncbi:MAG: hypothetical protein R3F40_06800 [Candidatus Competibacteraceae bacterium]
MISGMGAITRMGDDRLRRHGTKESDYQHDDDRLTNAFLTPRARKASAFLLKREKRLPVILLHGQDFLSYFCLFNASQTNRFVIFYTKIFVLSH